MPIYKSGSRHLANNYPPISLTSVVGKILESIIRDHILHHLTVNGLISQQQHGFLPHHSCTSQLLTALNDWTFSIDQGFPTDVIYFDFRKAFDTVPHARLLLKLEEYGINGNLLRWLDGFYPTGGKEFQSIIVSLHYHLLLVVFCKALSLALCCSLFMSMIYHPVLVAPY